MSNEQTVKDVYAAFQRGDVPAILARVADDVVWRNDGIASAECPWNGNFSGRARVPGFFKELAEHVEFKVFDIKAMLVAGSQVAVRLRIEGVIRNTGKAWKNDAVHWWTFTERGQIATYQHFNDTAAELAAWRG